MAKYCIRCGSAYPPNSNVCGQCGNVDGGRKSKEDLGEADEPEWEEPGEADELKTNFSLEKLHDTNRLVKVQHVTEVECEKDFFFVLSDDAGFSSTEYKVLNSIRNTGLLRCKKMIYNGKTALYYCAESYKSMKVLLPTLDVNRFLIVLENILNQIMEVEENGFLAGTAIDARISKIYVDSSNGKVYLTYLPIKERCYSDVIYLESQLRKDLAYIMRSFPGIQANNTKVLAQMMEDLGCSFENLLTVIRQKRSMSTNTGK